MLTGQFRFRRQQLWLAMVVFWLPWCLGCQTTTAFFRPAVAADQPWQIPQTEYPSQRLYRIQYQGPEGKLSFRLTLYLQDRSQYRMDASDSLGRQVFSLFVDRQGSAVWVDHRQEAYCRAAGAREQSFVPIAYLPLNALPRLLLGALPAEPLGDVARDESQVSYFDSQGQEWNAGLEAGFPRWWTLVEDGDAIAWWRVQGKENIFSDRRGGQQVRWKEQVREPLAHQVTAAEIPSSYREAICDADLP